MRIRGLMCVVSAGAMVAAGCAGSSVRQRGEIRHLLQVQADAWNRGDIESFMGAYRRADDLTFTSGGETTRGWSATLERYRRRYSTPEEMGTLTFGDLEVRLLGERSALVLGNWDLDRHGGPAGGKFSLVLQHIGGAWRIIHDHTSAR